MAKYLATSLAMEKVVSAPRGDQQLLADLNNLDELGGVAVQIHHIARFPRRHGAGVHGDSHIGLGQGRCVVGAVAAHGDQLAFCLLVADQLQLGLRGRLRQKIVHARLGGDGGRGQGVVAGDHHRADTHFAQFGKTLLDAALDDVLELNDTQKLAVPGDSQGRAPRFGDRVGDFRQSRAIVRTGADMGQDGIDRAFADGYPFRVNAADARVGRERNEAGIHGGHIAATDAVFLLGQHNNGASLGRLVGQRGQLRRFGQFLGGDAGGGVKIGCLTIAQGDGAGFVQKQRVHIAGRFHGAARHGQDVKAHQPVHAGNADGGQKRADGGGESGLQTAPPAPGRTSCHPHSLRSWGWWTPRKQR